MISLLQTFGVSVVLPRATSVSVSERYQPPRYRWRFPRFSGISRNLPLLFWAVFGRSCPAMRDLLVSFWSVSVRFSVVRVFKKDANGRGRFSASRSTQFPNIACLHLRKVDQNKTRKKGKTQENDTTKNTQQKEPTQNEHEAKKAHTKRSMQQKKTSRKIARTKKHDTKKARTKKHDSEV